MSLNKKELSSNIDDSEDVDNVTTVDEGLVTDEIYEEHINNKLYYPIDAHKGVTGTVFEEDGVLYIQKCLQDEFLL